MTEAPAPEAGALYLVTGGAGFIGSHLVEALLEGGARVRVLDDFSTGSRENVASFADRIELLEGSVTDPDTCREACRSVDFVFHEAAVPSVARSVDDPAASHAAGATGTLNMLIAAREAGVRRLVNAGSSSVYGDTPELPKREETRPLPLSPYAVAKLTGEHYCRVFAHVHGMETVTLRYFNVFGPRQDPTSPYSGVIAVFCRQSLAGRPHTIHGDGGQTRDFTYVENAVEANLRACHAPPEGVVGGIFNVGVGERTSVLELSETIREIAGRDDGRELGDPRPGDVRDSLASLERIRAALGYEGAVDLRVGLRRTWEWYREHPERARIPAQSG